MAFRELASRTLPRQGWASPCAAAAYGTDPSTEEIGTATAALAERLADGGTLLAASELPSEWPTSRDGLRVHDLGKIPLSKESDSYDGELLVIDEGSDAGEDVYEEPTTEVVAFDVASRHAYRVVADLTALEDEVGHLLRQGRAALLRSFQVACCLRHAIAFPTLQMARSNFARP